MLPNTNNKNNSYKIKTVLKGQTDEKLNFDGMLPKQCLASVTK